MSQDSSLQVVTVPPVNTVMTGPAIEPPNPHKESAARDMQVAGRNAITLGLSLAATWGVALLVRFQLPRYLGPVEFGAYNFSEAFSASFFTFAELGVDTYIVRTVTSRRKHASDFVGGILLVRLAVFVVLMTSMYFALGLSGRSDTVRLTVMAFGATHFVMVNNNSLAALLQASTKVGRLAIANVLSKVLWGLGLAAAILLQSSLALLVIPLLLSELVKGAVLVPVVRKAAQVEFRIDSAMTRMVLLASLPYFLNTGAVSIGARLTAAALEFATPNKHEVGWYGAAANLAGLAMLFSPLVSWVMMPLLARACERSEDEAYAILRRALEVLMVLIVPVTLFIGLGADELVLLAFGKEYAASALSLKVLAFDFLPMYIAIVTSVMLVLTGRHWYMTGTSIIAVPLRAIAIVPLSRICGEYFGVGGVAVGAALTEVLAISLTAAVSLWFVGRRAIDRQSAWRVAKSLFVAGLVILLDRVVPGHVLWRLTVDMLTYCILALVLRVVTIGEIRQLIALLKPGSSVKDETVAPIV